MSVRWCDFAEFQPVINDQYPWPVASFRSNDGTYRDPHFQANLAWCKGAVASGKLAFFIVYVVYEPDGGNWVSTLMSQVGTPHPAMVVMIDVENWNGRIRGDHSADINAGRARIAQWLGDPRRVIGYGNTGDLNNLWPNKGDAQLVVAAYGSNPSYPGKIAHQYTSTATCAPFGFPVDMNSADGVDVPTLMAMLGLTPDPNNVGPVTPFDPIQEEDMSYSIVPFSGGPDIYVVSTVTGLAAHITQVAHVGLLQRLKKNDNNDPMLQAEVDICRTYLAQINPAPVVPAPTIDVQALATAVVAAVPTGTVPPAPEEIAAAVGAYLVAHVGVGPFEIK